MKNWKVWMDMLTLYEEGKLATEGMIKLFGYLIRTKKVWSLQGAYYGATAEDLIKNRYILEDGTIIKVPITSELLERYYNGYSSMFGIDEFDINYQFENNEKTKRVVKLLENLTEKNDMLKLQLLYSESSNKMTIRVLGNLTNGEELVVSVCEDLINEAWREVNNIDFILKLYEDWKPCIRDMHDDLWSTMMYKLNNMSEMEEEAEE